MFGLLEGGEGEKEENQSGNGGGSLLPPDTPPKVREERKKKRRRKEKKKERRRVYTALLSNLYDTNIFQKEEVGYYDPLGGKYIHDIMLGTSQSRLI